MQFCAGKHSQRRSQLGFTLVEVMISFLLLALVVSGVILGYTQANRMADYTAMSYAGMAKSLQGAEAARSAHWDPQGFPPGTGMGTPDELPANNSVPLVAVVTNIDFMDMPTKGTPDSTNFTCWVTNYIYVTTLSVSPNMRQIQSDAIWFYPPTGATVTNTTILLRAPDE